jgi:formamidopyrimidine-DNA glycosylase
LPELPEVETVVRSIAPHVTGQRIERAELFSKLVTRGDLKETARRLRRNVIQGVRRRGKQIFMPLDRGVLYVHLGMTGKLLWNGSRGKYTRAALTFDSGTLLYDDVRQFGRVEYFEAVPKNLERVGPDALSLTFEEFEARLRQRTAGIKSVLLNQSFIAGVGNIYADEVLFAARIHPRAAASRLSKRRSKELYTNLIEVLGVAIEHRGSSVSDYVDGAGNRGAFQDMHNVYGHAGEACPRCHATIRRIVVAQRGTHYCPRCQRA